MTTVVLAEDEILALLDLKETLEEDGYEVLGAFKRGYEALAFICEFRPNLAIVDIKMPDLDGLTLARHLASERICPVVIVTAFGSSDIVAQTDDAGALGYILKPYGRAQLFSTIEIALGRSIDLGYVTQPAVGSGCASTDIQPGEKSYWTSRLETMERARQVLTHRFGLNETDALRLLVTFAERERRSIGDISTDILSDEQSAASKVREWTER